jgi:catechol 2,3-dioxygenase-like lactoylglutathione lyase family enzyme
MIKHLSQVLILVLDQEAAKQFYTEKLGVDLRTDEPAGPIRWLTIGPPEQDELEILLLEPGPPLHDDETARQLRDLVAKGALGGWSFDTDDCRATYEELKGRGVEFTKEPTEEEWGVSAVFKDDSGNWFNLVERT